MLLMILAHVQLFHACQCSRLGLCSTAHAHLPAVVIAETMQRWLSCSLLVS